MNGQRPTGSSEPDSPNLKGNPQTRPADVSGKQDTSEFENPVRAASVAQERRAERFRNHEAASSQRPGDPNERDPEERSDMISERRNPGMHGGAGDCGWKPSRPA